MAIKSDKKNGAALVIVLGFLAILTITIIAFTTQTRSERIAGRAFSSAAQTRHLLGTALTRAMEDIDTTTTDEIYPSFFALGSTGDAGSSVADSLSFDLEESFFAAGNKQIKSAYENALNTAEWQTVSSASGKTLGRVGYIIINSSGLLDANAVGGATSNHTYSTRRSGISPREIQLSNDNRIIPEFNNSAGRTAYPNIDTASPGGTPRTASPASLSPALAFAYNRDNAWHHFETLRDVYRLNQMGSPNRITTPIASFSTFSYDPRRNERIFMGNSEATLNEEAIRAELKNIPAANPDFVLNQLRDYMDQDTLPEDAQGKYTDLSVEPVPLINELVMTCNFTFTPELSVDDDGVATVVSVAIENTYSVELEAWYPFVGYTNTDIFTVHINDTPEQSGNLPAGLFGNGSGDGDAGSISDWTGDFTLPETITYPGSDPFNILIHTSQHETEVSTPSEMINLFREMQSDIQFPSIYCDNQSKDRVDQVIDLELPLETAVADELLPFISALATNVFDPNSADMSNQFVVAMSCVDPRLNWDGTSTNQWKEETDAGEGALAGTLGAVNENMINDYAAPFTPDDTIHPKIFVRNDGRIDTPFEFTYLLYDPTQPWKTFQMLKNNDADNTRVIMKNLTTFPDGPPKRGRVNPYSPHTNVIASVFMNMPVDEYMGAATRRLSASQAEKAAEQFMAHIAQSGWPDHASEYGDPIYNDVITDTNPWVQESFFRNTYELFNPRDSLFTILLAAQNGTDFDDNGILSDQEVRSTQQAVVYIWRDPETGKAACVFYGLSDTLSSSLSNRKWNDILQSFKP